MEDLQSVMSIIDRYTEAITEGDYLDLCNKLRDAYNKRTDPVYMFDYENFSIPRSVPTIGRFSTFMIRFTSAPLISTRISSTSN